MLLDEHDQGMDTTGIPHPAKRVPVVGDVVGLSGDTPIQDNMRLAAELGPIFAKNFFGREVVLVSGADLVAELSDETRFAKHVAPSLERIRAIAGDGLFTAYNDEPNWHAAHAVLLPAFSLQSMRGYHPTMLRVANRLVAAWDARDTVDVADDMTRLTLDTIGLTGFGFDFESFDRAEPHPFVQALVRGLRHAQAKTRELPWIGPILSRKADERFARDVDLMNGIVDDVIKARKGTTGGDDLLGLMLNSDLDDVNIRNQVITFLIAGHETTSGALSFAMYYLMKNPVVLAQAQAEVDALWGDQENPRPTYEEVGRLRYIRQVLNESLRLWPTAAAFAREATVDTTLGGYPIRRGQWAVVLAPSLHRDPVWGDNVEAFDPDRFTPEREKTRPVHAFKPFGTGERACIGRQFALHEATLLLGLLIHRYRLLDTDDYQLKVKETLTLKPTGFRLGLARRTMRKTVETATKDRNSEGVLRPGATVTILHGSNLGTCRAIAKQFAEEATDHGITATTSSLNDFVGHREGTVVVVAASYNGQPTDDAREFVDWLDTNPDLSRLTYAILGVGDRNWAATYQHVPTSIDARLAELGATRLLTRGEADASGDLTGDIEAWTDHLWGAAPQDTRLYDVKVIEGPVTAALDERYEVVPMTVLANDEMVTNPIGKSKRHLRIRLPEGVTYRTGDHLTVLPSNSPSLVERVADRFGLDLETVIAVSARQKSRRALPIDRPLTIRQLLTHFTELLNPATEAQVHLLAATNPCPPERARMTADGRSALEILEANPACQLKAEEFLELLPPMQARHYSISSSALASPGEVELIVSLVRNGVSSGYLRDVEPGDQIRARVDPARDVFRPNHSRPMIMVSAGTGLAPFRGFVLDRVHQGITGPALCFFGARREDVDYLHRAELEDAERLGAVSMRPAFSRAERPMYVQDRILADADDVRKAVAAGAVVYVCGDGKGMAPAVRAAFDSVEPGCVARLLEEGRYVEDVWA
jgi:cytochrome P450/NADPH-cytochrome P450 reductase